MAAAAAAAPALPANVLSIDARTGKKSRPEDCTMLIYHANCPDGFAAAWAAKRARGDACTYVPMEHGAPPPDVKGKHVVVADFSFSEEITRRMIAEAASFIVLDHHASAQSALASIPDEHKVFEMRMSGCTLAWCFFHAPEPVPTWMRYFEDRDIWRWAFPDSEAFSAASGLTPLTHEALDALHAKGDAGISEAIGKGRVILDYKNGVRDGHVKRAVKVELKAAPGLVCGIVNASTMASEIGNAICKAVEGVHFAAMWSWDHAKRSYYVSLRSDTDAVDVSAIAKVYGGGGHKRAAGFSFFGASIEELIKWPASEGTAAAAAGGAAGAGAAGAPAAAAGERMA